MLRERRPDLGRSSKRSSPNEQQTVLRELFALRANDLHPRGVGSGRLTLEVVELPLDLDLIEFRREDEGSALPRLRRRSYARAAAARRAPAHRLRGGPMARVGPGATPLPRLVSPLTSVPAYATAFSLTVRRGSRQGDASVSGHVRITGGSDTELVGARRTLEQAARHAEVGRPGWTASNCRACWRRSRREVRIDESHRAEAGTAWSSPRGAHAGRGAPGRAVVAGRGRLRDHRHRCRGAPAVDRVPPTGTVRRPVDRRPVDRAGAGVARGGYGGAGGGRDRAHPGVDDSGAGRGCRS